MSKIFMIGDTHAYIYPLDYLKWMKTLKNYFYKFYIPMLKERSEKGDICIHTGDLFHNRTYVPLDVMVDIEKILIEISNILPLHIILGNHDLFTKDSSEYNYIRFYRNLPNIHVYESPETITFNKNKLLLLPWVENTEEQKEILDSNRDCDYVFCHSDLKGAKLHANSVSNKRKEDDKIDIESFNGFKHVYSGHIHIVQETKNFTFIGSTYHMDRGDIGNKRGVFILDTNTGKHEFIPNDISPEFKRIKIHTEGDLLLMKSYRNKEGSYIDLEVSNALFVGNRTNKKVLNEIMETTKFERVEYVSNKEKKEVTIKVIDEDTIKYSGNELIPHILEYSSNVDYDSDKIRKGSLSLLQEVIDIYNNSKKSD